MTDQPAPVAEAAPKPPPQVINAGGVEAARVMGGSIDWAALFRLPPYQKWVEEQVPNRLGAPSDRYAMEYTLQRAERMGPEAVYQDYCNWHAKTGLWPCETPEGKLKET